MKSDKFPKQRPRRTEPTTETKALSPVRLPGKNDTDRKLPASQQGRAQPAVEATVILIAHPDNKMLGNRYNLSPGSTLEIGRSLSAQVSLPDVLSVSRNHARLDHADEGVRIQDLGSTNGTFINDVRIAGPTALASGDRFQVGAVHFKFLHEADVEHAYHEAIYNLVMRDGLTAIYNKTKCDEELAREFARAVRYRRPLALIIFDIDHFKQINDKNGHLCGDFVLKQVTALVASHLRSEEIFARVGGEEFAILAPETEAEGGRALAEKIRGKIASYECVYSTFRIPVTASFGVAGLTDDMLTPQDLYSTADRAMYKSKQHGRNRVSLA